MSTPAQPGSPRPGLRKRILIPAVVVALLVLFLIGAIVRGTWADTEARNPTDPSEGIIRQVFLTPEGHKIVRCAMVLDHPLDQVWAVVTDYEHFPEIFSTLRSARAESAGDGTVRLSGEARAFFTVWPFDIVIRHQITPDRRSASWTGEGDRVRMVHGSWTLTPAGPNRTLLVYASEVEVPGYPGWFVRNVLLTRQPKVLQAVADRLERKEDR